jgi:hypothetical protein
MLKRFGEHLLINSNTKNALFLQISQLQNKAKLRNSKLVIARIPSLVLEINNHLTNLAVGSLMRNIRDIWITGCVSDVANQTILQKIATPKGIQLQNHNLSCQKVSQLPTNQLSRVDGRRKLAFRLLPLRIKITSLILKTKSLLMLNNYQKTSKESSNHTPNGLNN